MLRKRQHLFIVGRSKLGCSVNYRERGRPKSADAKSKHLDVRLADDQLQAIEDAAKIKGVSTTAWARDVLVKASQPASATPEPPADYDDVVRQLNNLTRQVGELTQAFTQWRTLEIKRLTEEAVAGIREEMTPKPEPKKGLFKRT